MRREDRDNETYKKIAALYHEQPVLDESAKLSSGTSVPVQLDTAQIDETLKQYQDAIAKLQMQRIAELQGENQAALAAAASLEFAGIDIMNTMQSVQTFVSESSGVFFDTDMARDLATRLELSDVCIVDAAKELKQMEADYAK